jgi:hypothetical protein
MPALEGKPTDDEVHLIAQYYVAEVPAVRLPPVPGPPDPRAPTQPAAPDQPEPVYPNKEPDDPGAPHEPEPDDPLRLNVDPRRHLQATSRSISAGTQSGATVLPVSHRAQ